MFRPCDSVCTYRAINAEYKPKQTRIAYTLVRHSPEGRQHPLNKIKLSMNLRECLPDLKILLYLNLG